MRYQNALAPLFPRIVPNTIEADETPVPYQLAPLITSSIVQPEPSSTIVRVEAADPSTTPERDNPPVSLGEDKLVTQPIEDDSLWLHDFYEVGAHSL